jgi:hypothetical protein
LPKSLVEFLYLDEFDVRYRELARIILHFIEPFLRREMNLRNNFEINDCFNDAPSNYGSDFPSDELLRFSILNRYFKY